ncbi:hypothetical protein D3C77_649250 [compost metagenome]
MKTASSLLSASTMSLMPSRASSSQELKPNSHTQRSSRASSRVGSSFDLASSTARGSTMRSEVNSICSSLVWLGVTPISMSTSSSIKACWAPA